VIERPGHVESSAKVTEQVCMNWFSHSVEWRAAHRLPHDRLVCTVHVIFKEQIF
jgi:hypothetical protein